MRAIRLIIASSFTRSVMWIVPIAFFFLNPNVGCGSDEPAFQFGAPEMLAAVEGNWSPGRTFLRAIQTKERNNVRHARRRRFPRGR